MTTTNVTIKVETQGTRKVEQLERSLKKTESASKQLEGSLGGLIGKLAAVTGVAIGLGSAFNSIVKFDKAQSALRTLGVNAEELTGKLNEVSKELKGAVSTAELTGAAFQVASAGFKKAGDNAKVLEAAATSSKAKFADLRVVAAATTSVLNAYGLGANKAAEVNDKFFQTIKDGTLTIEEYSTSIGRVASISAQSGISLAEINAVVSIATQKGVIAAEAFTGLGAAIKAILAPSDQAKKLAAELGVEFSEAALRQKGLVGVLEDVQKATGGSNEKLVTLFGSAEALKTLAPGLANNLDELKAALDRQNNSAGVAKKAFDEAGNSIAASIQRIQNSYKNLIDNQNGANQTLIAGFDLINAALIALNSEQGDTIIKAALVAAGFFGVVKAVLALKAAIVALKATALAGWITSQIALLTTFGVKIYATAAATGVLTAATKVLSTAMLAVPWAAAIAGAIAAANATYQAFAAWVDFNRVLNQAPLDEVTQKIKTLKGELIEAESKTVSWYEAILDFIIGVDGASTAVAGLTARIDELNQRRIQLTDLRPEQGADLDMEEIGRLSNLYEAPKITTPTVVSGGGGGGGGAKPRESDAPQLQRDLELKTKLLGIDKDILEAQLQENRLLIEANKIRRIEAEFEGKRLDILASKRYEDEKALEIRNAEIEKADALQQLDFEGLFAAKQRREALEGILSPLNEEIELLQARLNGNEKEIKQKQEIARLQKEITGQGGDPAQAAGLIKTRDALIELNKQQDKAKAQAEELAGAIASSLTSSLRGLIDGSKTAEQALSDAFKGIADAFLDMAMKMIQEWIKMQVIGLVGNLFGGSPASGLGGAASGAQGIGAAALKGFADGGRPEPNKVSVVGEKGPELFVPDTVGTVISNDAFAEARGAMGSGGSGSSDAFAENADAIAVSNSYTRERMLERESQTREGSASSMVIETQVINNVEYATVDQVNQAATVSAKQARAQVFSDMKNRPATRRLAGIR